MHNRFKGLAERSAELTRLLADVAVVDFGHPAGWIAVHGTALLEGIVGAPAEQSFYLDGSLHADTFMARRVSPERGAAAIASAVMRARAICRALDVLDGTLPGQPLHCVLAAHGRWMDRVSVARGRVAFATPVGNFIATMDDDAALATDLGRVACGAVRGTNRLVPLGDARAPTAAVGVVSLRGPPDRALFADVSRTGGAGRESGSGSPAPPGHTGAPVGRRDRADAARFGARHHADPVRHRRRSRRRAARRLHP